MLLYLGSVVGGLMMRLGSHERGPRITRQTLPRLALVALLGAAIAPVCLAWGLPRVGATTGSLLLNLEAPFTVLLARVLYREPLGGRVMVAIAFTAAGAVCIGVGTWLDTSASALGALAVAAATLCWALDSALSRPLADLDPLSVVVQKGAMGAVLTFAGARAFGEPMPHLAPALTILTTGIVGYGVSLALYLNAQRHVGAARTASVFAVAPFAGALVGWILGDRALGPAVWASLGLFLVGLYLHSTEHHGHKHSHPRTEHEHTHRHDDGHHDHVHDPPFAGEHSHVHGHEPIEHDHEHGPDLHHDHVHSR
jgi:drug/metabolite transporter (DMT)-like permease